MVVESNTLMTAATTTTENSPLTTPVSNDQNQQMITSNRNSNTVVDNGTASGDGGDGGARNESGLGEASASNESEEHERRRQTADTHLLSSTARGGSDIEKIVLDIEARREKRLPITFTERKKFLDVCMQVAKCDRQNKRNRIPKMTLVRLRDEFKKRVDDKPGASLLSKLLDLFGCPDLDESMLKLFNAGLVWTEEADENDFFFLDFNYYCTKLVSRFPIMRYPQLAVVSWLLLYFFGSAFVFCAIMKNENVCPSTTGFAFGGWMSAIYFAGVTMSTVGYGDLSLYDEEKPGVTFVGTIFMLISIMVGYTVFSTAAEMTLGRFVAGFDMYAWLDRKSISNPDTPLYQQIRRLVLLRIGELVFYFLALNLVGASIARAFVNRSPAPEEQWNWSTTLYYAVQTTTTIGYGDISQPFLLRWVNIFFCTFGTAFIGSVFGSIASLRSDINDLRRYHAWKRRDVSRQLIKELQVNDNKLDQFEFFVGSLILLGKLNSADVIPIMDKFRALVGPNGFIMDFDDVTDVETTKVDDQHKINDNLPDGNEPITAAELEEIPGGRDLLDVFKRPNQELKDFSQYIDIDTSSGRV